MNRSQKKTELILELKAALEEIMEGQRFDYGNHLIERARPSHAAVIKSRMLLYRINHCTHLWKP